MSQEHEPTTAPPQQRNPLATFDVLDRASEIRTVPMDNELALYLNPVLFEQGMRAANALAKSGLLPKHYNDNPPACFLLLAMSAALHLNPIMLAQKSYTVHGKFGFEAQAAIALANKSGLFAGPLDWEYAGTGDAREVTCFAVRKSNGKRLTAECSVAMAKAFGWWSKTDSLWPKMTDQMLAYRSAAFLIRRYTPEVLLGLYTVDELQDMGPSIDAEYSVINQAAGGEPVYDTAPFDNAVAAEGIAVNDAHLVRFIEVIAGQSRISPEKVKVEAAKDIPRFLEKFSAWVKKNTPPAPPAEKKSSAASSAPKKQDKVEPAPQAPAASKEIECPIFGSTVRTGVECPKCDRKSKDCPYWMA